MLDDSTTILTGRTLYLRISSGRTRLIKDYFLKSQLIQKEEFILPENVQD
jgi:hypothetical protein